MDKKLRKLMQGHKVQFKHSELENLPHDIFSDANAQTIMKSHMRGKGVRLQLDQNESQVLGGKIGFKKIGKAFKSAVKTVNKVPKQLGSDYTVGQMIKKYDQKHNLSKSVKNFAENEFDKTRQKVKSELRNPKKIGQAVLRHGAKMARKAGLDTDLMDNASSFVIQQTLGRVDPTLADMAVNKLQNSKTYNKIQDKVNKQLYGEGIHIAKGGSFRGNGIQGGSFRPNGGALYGGNVKVYDDQSPFLRPDQPAFTPLPPKSLRSQKGI